MMRIGENSSVCVDVIARLDLMSLHSVRKQTHFSLCHVTPHINTIRLIYFHIIHVIKGHIYTKIQSYMQCGTMSVKNLVRRLGVHDKTNHTLVSQVILTR